MPGNPKRHTAATWARVWDLWLTTDIPTREISARTGVGIVRIAEKANWIRSLDPSFPTGRDRRAARTLRKLLADQELLADPVRGQVRRARARKLGADVPVMRRGQKPPPQELIDSIVLHHHTGASAPAIAAVVGKKPAMVAGAVHRLQKAGVLKQRRPGVGGRPPHRW